MSSPQQIIALTLAAALASAGSVTVNNGCAGTIYYASATPGGTFGSTISIPAGKVVTVGPTGGSGMNVALFKSAGTSPYTGSKLELEWTATNGDLYYDLASANGDPFASGSRSLFPIPTQPSGFPDCTAINYNAGTSAPTDPTVKTCPVSDGLQLLLANC